MERQKPLKYLEPVNSNRIGRNDEGRVVAQQTDWEQDEPCSLALYSFQ